MFTLTNLFQNKVSSVTFFCGQSTDELIKLKSLEVETRLLGSWINCPITGKNDSITGKKELFSQKNLNKYFLNSMTVNSLQ